MLNNFDDILGAALALPSEDRARLADELVVSLDGLSQEQIEAAWAEEIERRIRDIDEGKVVPIDGEQVMRELRARRGRE